MPSFLAIALMSGLVCAGVHAFALSGIAGGGIVSLLSPTPLYYAAFAAGPLAGLFAAGIASVGVALLQGEVAALVFLSIWGLPAAVVGGLVSRKKAEPGQRLSSLVEWLSLCGMFLLMLGIAFLSGMTGWASPVPKIVSMLDARVLETSSQMALSPEAVSDMFRSLAGVLPGLGAMMWLMLMFISALVAQRIWFRKGGDTSWNSGMAGLRLPRWMLPVFAAMAFMGLLGRGLVSFAGVNVVCLLLFPFLLDGLGVVHDVIARYGKRASVWIWFMYGSLLMFNVLAILVAGLGMMDQWGGFRRKLAETFPGRENE